MSVIPGLVLIESKTIKIAEEGVNLPTIVTAFLLQLTANPICIILQPHAQAYENNHHAI